MPPSTPPLPHASSRPSPQSHQELAAPRTLGAFWHTRSSLSARRCPACHCRCWGWGGVATHAPAGTPECEDGYARCQRAARAARPRRGAEPPPGHVWARLSMWRWLRSAGRALPVSLAGDRALSLTGMPPQGLRATATARPSRHAQPPHSVARRDWCCCRAPPGRMASCCFSAPPVGTHPRRRPAGSFTPLTDAAVPLLPPLGRRRRCGPTPCSRPTVAIPCRCVPCAGRGSRAWECGRLAAPRRCR